MKKPALLSTVITSIVFISSAPASNLENEPPVAQIESTDKNFSLRTSVYMQARMEYGDLIYGKNAEIKSSSLDIYFRKASVGFYGNAIYPNLKYGITLSGDETPQEKVYPSYSENNGISLNGTYIDYQSSDHLAIRFGKEKLPYSRIYLVSSTRQAFSERPYYMFSWESVLRTYAHTHISAYGSLPEGFFYTVSIGRAWRSGDELYDQAIVSDASPQFTGRLQWSPQNWGEKKLSDANLGTGQHFTVGLYSALQEHIEYTDTNSNSLRERRSLYGLDLSFHKKELNLQAEVNGWAITPDDVQPKQNAIGWLAQASYYIASIYSEPAIRYEQFDFDTHKTDNEVRKVTIGFNTYFQKNNLKLMLNLEHTKFGDDASLLKPSDSSTSIAFRTTLQFIL